MTIFLTTHYMEETRDANHVVILDKGRIIARGTPTELKSRYASSKLLWYTSQNPENDRIAEKILAGREREGQSFVYDADHYRIPFEGDILETLTKEREHFHDFEILKGTMDDVFLNLTGRRIASEA